MRNRSKNRRVQFKRFIIGLYSLVIVGIGIGLYSVLQSGMPLHDKTPAPVVEEDPEVVAVLSAMGEGEVTVPIKDLDNVIPERPERRDPAWLVHSISWRQTNLPRIAIVIDDLGLSLQATERLALIPGPLTLAYLPYADDLPYQTRLVHAAGHELMVHLPMEPKAKSADPGTNALLGGLPSAEFERRLNWNLSRFDGYVGVNNHMGSLLTEDASHMVQVMMHLKQDGFLFLDSLTSPDSVGIRAAKATGVPTIARDIFLDNVQHRTDIDKQLAKVERIARMRGYAIAIGHPYPVTLDALKDWRATLADKGLALVPISQLVGAIEGADQHAANIADRAR